jgi:hypothetical protein
MRTEQCHEVGPADAADGVAVLVALPRRRMARLGQARRIACGVSQNALRRPCPQVTANRRLGDTVALFPTIDHFRMNER